MTVATKCANLSAGGESVCRYLVADDALHAVKRHARFAQPIPLTVGGQRVVGAGAIQVAGPSWSSMYAFTRAGLGGAEPAGVRLATM